jgi:putative heme-binding domain-containing protein
MKLFFPLLAITLLLQVFSAHARPPAPAENLSAKPLANSLGLNLHEYTLSWDASSQAGYQVLVAGSEAKLAANVGDLWDSGLRYSENNAGIPCLGKAFRAGSKAWWKVRTWKKDGSSSAWSGPATISIPAGKISVAGDKADPKPDASPAENRVVFVGGSLIHGMEKNAYLEAALTARWPHHDITFRNLGWPADDVFGTARGEFGSAHNTRSWKPPGNEAGFGYSELLKQVREAKPTTLIVGYGGEAAFADSEDRMQDFRAGYEKLITDLEATGARIILLTPIPHQEAGHALPDPSAHNARLRTAAQFILKSADERKHLGVDIFGEDPENSGELQYRDALHLSAPGYRVLAGRIAKGLGLASESLLKVREANDRLSVTSETIKTGERTRTKNGVRLDLILDRLPSAASPLLVTSSAADTELSHDDSPIRMLEPDAKKSLIFSGPDHQQAERLRQLIIAKNSLYRHKLRPINKTYIFLFRRHEMGHLAREMEDFDELVEGKEELIAKLRVPAANRYGLKIKPEWRAPRAYPDHEVPKNIPAPDTASELADLTVADGFQVNLFAANPMIANPINLNWDTRGRAWVSTSTTYPHIKPGHVPNDRIVILEDTDQDGVADKHTVFAEGLTVPHSVMPVEGGAFVCSTTEFLFLEDKDGDDRSESRRVIYSGFGNADVHHMIHGLRWAPWGDLYFTQSIYINTFVETAHGPRRMNGSGIWRFRPDNEQLDAYAVGMVNPWGFAFDYWGQSFGTDGAGGSGPHYVFPGSAFRSAVGVHRVFNGLIPGKPKNTAAEFISGGHMPERWQGSIVANDFRANRTVRYELEENGSGYTAKEVETVLHSKHRSFRPVDLKMGPEGALYVVDWYNPIIDHGEVDFHHPSRDKAHGRIWRVTAKASPLLKRDKIAGARAEDLLDFLKSPAEYTREQARRELASHSPEKLVPLLKEWLNKLDKEDPGYEHHRLEALWLIVSLRAAEPALAGELLRSSLPQVRAAAVRAVANWSPRAGPIDKISLFAQAIEDPHPRVRLEAINALRELGTNEAASVALRALAGKTDNNISYSLELTVRALRDKWLPAMQSGKPVFDGDPSRLAYALKEVGDARAIAALVAVIKEGGIAEADMPQAVTNVAALGASAEIDSMLEMAKKNPALLSAIAVGAATNTKRPGQSQAVAAFLESTDSATRNAAALLCGTWKISTAREKLITLTGAENLAPTEASALCGALAQLGAANDLEKLAADGQSVILRSAAIAAWAGSDAQQAASPAVKLLGSLGEQELDEARGLFAAFITRSEGATALAGKIASTKLSKPVAIAGLRLARASGRELPGLIAALNSAASIKPLVQNLSPAERSALLAEAAKSGNAERGREVYHRKAMLCTACHVINNQGGKLGPDLSTVGSYMTPESLLESLINPSSAIKQGYETAMVTTKDNQVMTGLVQRKTGSALLLRDPSGNVVSIANSNIAKTDTSPVSLMPPGLTVSLRRDEMIDLMRYLTSLGKSRP